MRPVKTRASAPQQHSLGGLRAEDILSENGSREGTSQQQHTLCSGEASVAQMLLGGLLNTGQLSEQALPVSLGAELRAGLRDEVGVQDLGALASPGSLGKAPPQASARAGAGPAGGSPGASSPAPAAAAGGAGSGARGAGPSRAAGATGPGAFASKAGHGKAKQQASGGVGGNSGSGGGGAGGESGEFQFDFLVQTRVQSRQVPVRSASAANLLLHGGLGSPDVANLFPQQPRSKARQASAAAGWIQAREGLMRAGAAGVDLLPVSASGNPRAAGAAALWGAVSTEPTLRRSRPVTGGEGTVDDSGLGQVQAGWKGKEAGAALGRQGPCKARTFSQQADWAVLLQAKESSNKSGSTRASQEMPPVRGSQDIPSSARGSQEAQVQPGRPVQDGGHVQALPSMAQPQHAPARPELMQAGMQGREPRLVEQGQAQDQEQGQQHRAQPKKAASFSTDAFPTSSSSKNHRLRRRWVRGPCGMC